LKSDPAFAKIGIAPTHSISLHGTHLVSFTWYVTVFWYTDAGATEERALFIVYEV